MIEQLCNICGMQFDTEIELKVHRRKMHYAEGNKKVRINECSICHRRFWTKKELKNHKWTMHVM